MRSIILLLALCFFGVSYGQNTHHHDHQSFENTIIPSVAEHDVIDFDNEVIYAQLTQDETMNLSINLGQYGVVSLTVEAYNMRSPNYTIQSQDGLLKARRTTKTLRGFTTDGGAVRLTIAEQFTYGYIEWENETYFIEPAWYYDEDRIKTDQIVVYRQSDVQPDHEMTCGADEMEKRSNHLLEQASATRSTGSRLGQCYEVELAIASDFSMYSKYNSSIVDVENHNIAVINNVNGDYTGVFDDDIEFNIVTQFISTCSTCDPWTSSNDAETLLIDFSDWGLANGFMTIHDLGELWTDRDFDGPTVGIAWVGGLCNPNSKYHCLQDHSNNAALLRVTTSHEIGHNFNAQHPPASDFIMSATVSITSDWHANSIAAISNYANLGGTQGCLSNCPAGSAPIPGMEPLATNICPETTIKFFDRSTNGPVSWSWSFPGGSPSSSSMQHPSVTYNIPGSYTVIQQVSNGAGLTTETYSNLINVGPGNAFPLYTDFDNGIADWAVDNPDNSTTWDEISPAAAPGGFDAVYINNFNYTNIGQRDGLESPIFSLAGYLEAILYVEYAYAGKFSGQRDSLIVYASGDGGQTFQRLSGIAENGSNNFNTSPAQSSAFEPSSLDDWCGAGSFGADCFSVNLSDFIGSRDVIVRIENYNQNGNNLYLDRVYVNTDCFDLPAPVSEFVADPISGCTPLIVQFEDQSQNSPFSWQWTFENGSPASSTDQHPTVIFTTPGQHTVTLLVTNETGGDLETKDLYIEVLTMPLANFTFDAVGSTVTFQNLSFSGVDFLWMFGDGNISNDENPVHTYQADGVYPVTLRVFNDCGEDEITMDVTIGSLPTAGYLATPLNGCVPQEVEFFSESSPNTTAVNWIFEGGNPASSTLTNPVVTYNIPGDYDVTIIAINSTGTDTLVGADAIHIEEEPVADFDYLINDLTVSLVNQSSAATSYDWTFGDGNVSTDVNPTHTYANQNVYDITLIASNACGADTMVQSVAIGGFPSASFSSNVSTGCAPLTVNFSADNAEPGDDILWTFDGGSPMIATVADPSVVYSTPGIYNVRCVVSNALGSDTSLVIGYISVLDDPEADFSVTDDGFLTAIMIYSGSAYNTIFWDFGDGDMSSDENPSHLYAQPNGWMITCIVTNDCGSDTLVQSYTRAQPLLEVTLSSGINCVNQSIQFNAEGNNNSPTFSWMFESGTPATSTSASPLVTYSQSGIYDVSLTATQNGASYTYNWEDTVIIEVEPMANFIHNLNSLTNISSNATSYSWFVDGTFRSNDENISIFNEGNYEVVLVAFNSCGSDTMTQEIIISATNSLPRLNKGMKILPNPNRGTFTLAFDKPVGTYKLSIIDSRGHLINQSTFDQQNQYLSLSKLAAGMYVLRAVAEEGIYIQKMIVVE